MDYFKYNLVQRFIDTVDNILLLKLSLVLVRAKRLCAGER